VLRLLQDVIPKATAVIDYEVEHDFPGIRRRRMLLTARRLFHPDTISPVTVRAAPSLRKRVIASSMVSLGSGAGNKRMCHIDGIKSANLLD
jgi:hypothetical protein